MVRAGELENGIIDGSDIGSVLSYELNEHPRQQKMTIHQASTSSVAVEERSNWRPQTIPEELEPRSVSCEQNPAVLDQTAHFL